MTKRILFLITALSMVILSACTGSSSKKSDPEQEKAAFQASLTEADTVIVSAMCEQFFGLMSSENYDQAFAMISELDDENRLAYLSDETKQGLKNRFSTFKIDKVELFECVFNAPFDNLFRYVVTTKSIDQNDNALFFRFAFNPVKIDGSWYLTLRTAPMKRD